MDSTVVAANAADPTTPSPPAPAVLASQPKALTPMIAEPPPTAANPEASKKPFNFNDQCIEPCLKYGIGGCSFSATACECPVSGHGVCGTVGCLLCIPLNCLAGITIGVLSCFCDSCCCCCNRTTTSYSTSVTTGTSTSVMYDGYGHGSYTTYTTTNYY